jgi:hypothetical protein
MTCPRVGYNQAKIAINPNNRNETILSIYAYETFGSDSLVSIPIYSNDRSYAYAKANEGYFLIFNCEYYSRNMTECFNSTRNLVVDK